MSDRQTVVYRARTAQDAHFLKNLLAEAQIWAAVTNDLLERGSGVDLLGWPTAARVVVREEDAPRARQIAEQFDRSVALKGAEALAEQSSEPPDTAAAEPDDWPTCPSCGKRRLTRCKICGTAGSTFARADMGFDWVPEPGDPLAAGSCGGESTCGCGSHGCSTAGPGQASPADDDADVAAVDPEEAAPAALVTCPTCDEPFVPRYARRCEWCGHEFADGYEVDPHGPSSEPPEQLNGRVIAVILGLLLLAGGLAAYFLTLTS